MFLFWSDRKYQSEADLYSTYSAPTVPEVTLLLAWKTYDLFKNKEN